MGKGLVAVFVAATLNVSSAATAQPPSDRSPVPAGQEIIARDGDIVVIEDGARVQIMKRHQATVRTVFDESAKRLILLVDYAVQPNGSPDGNVDVSYSYEGLEGNWPLGARWEAFTTLEEYLPGPFPSAGGIGLATPNGLVQILFGPGPPGAGTPSMPGRAAAAVLTARGFGTTGQGRTPPVSFDVAEREQFSSAYQAGLFGGYAQGGANTTGSAAIVSQGLRTYEPGRGPLRVGGAIQAPQKIRDAAPVYPDTARQGDVRGVVVLELTVAADGSVTDPRVLRSIPPLDQAALDAVRQWQYEPVLLNGVPVPVTMTVSVPVAP